MVIHHFFYDLVYYLDAPPWLYENPVFNVLHYIFAGLFVFISGISSRFSRGNIKRGFITLAFAMGITIVTYFMGTPVWFGILHLLGLSMLFFGLTKKIWDKIPRKLTLALLIKLLLTVLVALKAYKPQFEQIALINIISVLGWPQPGFISYDYFPIFPWVIIFLFGTWAGIYIIEKKLPSWFYTMSLPFFPKVGRNSLLIYILHQPILYVFILVIGRFLPI